tara:strand:- start:9 stop:1133 length:1125 start_codon:yes stop_codon:yes gene_type:complete
LSPTILIAGLGDLGAVVLELLARERWPGRIIAGSRDLGRTQARVNLARLGAIAQGCRPVLESVHLDLDDEAQTADLIRRVSPDVILSTATRQSWLIPERLPNRPRMRLNAAGFGVWLPIHLDLSVKLMRALRESGVGTHTLIAPFPDVANLVLSRLGMQPTSGVGNIDEIVPKVATFAATRLGVSIDEIEVTLVAHHAFGIHAFEPSDRPRPPHFLRVAHNGTDVTKEFDSEELLCRPYPLPPGPATHFLTAGSTLRLMCALTSRETRLHAPGPEGLPGGYPILAGPSGVRVPVIPNLSRQEAIEINERSHPFDGIEMIEPDGTVVFRQEAVDIMDRELGYRCSRLDPADISNRAGELLRRFRLYAKRHGLQVG